ncbi:ABC transporter type 1, transmembrane domain-containing protein [Zopfochytrium polystomum]|nr:ABC transporter type 1, transmembrane domain-containing protein [Zopfochytrium polystomum]
MPPTKSGQWPQTLSPPPVDDEDNQTVASITAASAVDLGDASVSGSSQSGGKKAAVVEVVSAGAGEDKEKKPNAKNAVGLFELFRFATPLDRFLIVIATILSASMGVLVPASVLVLGSMLNSATGLYAVPNIIASGYTLPANQTSQYLPDYNVTIGYCPDGHTLHGLIDWPQFNPIIWDFFYFGLAMLVAGYFSQCLWVLTGENQTRKIRELYLQAILRQDMGWFDKAEEGSLTTRLAQDTQLIQEGISEKFGAVIMSSAQFVSGIVIAFAKGWHLAIVVLAAFPVMAAVGMIMLKTIVARVRQGQGI